jgi:hypothetical protein
MRYCYKEKCIGKTFCVEDKYNKVQSECFSDYESETTYLVCVIGQYYYDAKCQNYPSCYVDEPKFVQDCQCGIEICTSQSSPPNTPAPNK